MGAINPKFKGDKEERGGGSSIDCIRFLLGRHADPNVVSDEARCAFLSAVQHNKLEIMSLLYENQADINCVVAGTQPIHLASRGGSDTTEWLLRKGVLADTLGNELETPAHEAAHYGH